MITTHQVQHQDTALQSAEIAGLVEAFSQIGKCACAILEPQQHKPVISTGWKPEWEEFTSILPHQAERFFAALSRLNWADVAKKPVIKFESAGRIVHAIAPVIENGAVRCYLYAGYILAARVNDADYVTIAHDRKFDSGRFLHVIHELPVLPEQALIASLTKLVTQCKSVLAKMSAATTEPTVSTSAAAAQEPRDQTAPWDTPDPETAPPWEQPAAKPIEQPHIPAVSQKPSPAATMPTTASMSETDMHVQIIRSLTRDIRTALNGSIGVTGLLMRRRDPEVTELLDTVHRGNDTLLTMLDHLHDYYDVISEQMPLMSAPFDVRIAAERAVDTVRKRVEETGVHLNIRFAQDMPEIIIGDAERFQQVLKNTLVTVSRYAVGGRLILATRKGNSGPEGTEIQFLVQNVVDSKTEQPASIDDDPTLKVYDSSDIGMVVSREIVRLLGGKMVVRTTEPPSAIFSIVLPEVKLDGYVFDTRASQALHNMSVAVIDEDTTELAALSLQCGYWGPYIKTFTKADEAFQWLNTNKPFDAVIISHRAAMKDAFMSKLKSSRLHAALPVIVYAGDVPAESIKHGSNGSEHIAVWETLREVLENTVSATTSAGPQPDMVNSLAELYPNKILVVEDDAMNRQLIERILKKLGYKPTIAANGIEAVKATSEKPFELIFMDLQMPGMDGITATKTILNDTVHATPPKIIALSANASQIDQEGAFKAGMVDFLSKPIILNKLQDAIIKWGIKVESSPLPAESAQSDSTLVDADVISQTRELDQFSEESILDRLIHGFIKEVPPLIDEIENGFASNNNYKITKSTSTIIGMCRNLGVKEFAAKAKDIDASASTADLGEMSKKLKGLKHSYQNTCAELKLYLSGPL